MITKKEIQIFTHEDNLLAQVPHIDQLLESSPLNILQLRYINNLLEVLFAKIKRVLLLSPKASQESRAQFGLVLLHCNDLKSIATLSLAQHIERLSKILDKEDPKVFLRKDFYNLWFCLAPRQFLLRQQILFNLGPYDARHDLFLQNLLRAVVMELNVKVLTNNSPELIQALLAARRELEELRPPGSQAFINGQGEQAINELVSLLEKEETIQIIPTNDSGKSRFERFTNDSIELSMQSLSLSNVLPEIKDYVSAYLNYYKTQNQYAKFTASLLQQVLESKIKHEIDESQSLRNSIWIYAPGAEYNQKNSYFLDLLFGDMAVYPHASAEYWKFVRAQLGAHSANECRAWAEQHFPELNICSVINIEALRSNVLKALDVLIVKRMALDKTCDDHVVTQQKAYRSVFYSVGRVLFAIIGKETGASGRELDEFIAGMLNASNPFNRETEAEAYFAFLAIYSSKIGNEMFLQFPHRENGQYPWVKMENNYLPPPFNLRELIHIVFTEQEKVKISNLMAQSSASSFRYFSPVDRYRPQEGSSRLDSPPRKSSKH